MACFFAAMYAYSFIFEVIAGNFRIIFAFRLLASFKTAVLRQFWASKPRHMVALLYIIYFQPNLCIFIQLMTIGFRMVIVLLRLYPHVVIWYERFNALFSAWLFVCRLNHYYVFGITHYVFWKALIITSLLCYNELNPTTSYSVWTVPCWAHQHMRLRLRL